MKKFVLLFMLSLCCTTIYSQKKKAVKKESSKVIATAGNLTAELVPVKDQFIFQVMVDKKDSLFTKKIDVKNNAKSPTMMNNNVPFDCKIVPFTAKGTPLYCITWSENLFTEVTDKKEDRTQYHTQIWNLATKSLVLGNVQTTTKITQILWLDKLKNASQTSEKMRNEGLAFTLTKEGDAILKSKSQETKLAYNPQINKYDNLRPAATAAPAAKPKKK
jgi:hypothetical protein